MIIFVPHLPHDADDPFQELERELVPKLPSSAVVFPSITAIEDIYDGPVLVPGWCLVVTPSRTYRVPESKHAFIAAVQRLQGKAAARESVEVAPDLLASVAADPKPKRL